MQLGYEARCALPHAFDVILGSQLGVGAYRALVENRADGVLVSVSGQLNLNYVPFDTLDRARDTARPTCGSSSRALTFNDWRDSLENYPHE